jgi:hypothetical protein
MKNWMSITLILTALVSCKSSVPSLAKSVDPLVGDYRVTAFDVPTYGDVKAKFRLTSEGGVYSADIRNDLNVVKVHKTEVTGARIYIEASAGSQDIYFNLTVKGDSVTGWLSDMYRVAGIKEQLKHSK